LGHYSRLGVDERIRPDATRRLWQVVCGRAGGPGRPKNDRLPWADKLEGFSEKGHFALVDVRRRDVEIVVFDSDETVIDRWAIAKPRR
jgi:hypothetical protein